MVSHSENLFPVGIISQEREPNLDLKYQDTTNHILHLVSLFSNVF